MLEKVLKKYLNFKNGYFIEVGAHDGVFQSNTLNLEKELGWTGLLIEPSLNAFLDCVKNRPNSKCLNIALTSYQNYKKKKFAYGDFNNSPMSSIAGKKSGFSMFQNIKDYFKKILKNELVPISIVPLQIIIDNLNLEKIDFMSLDVEGFELEVLNGIDFKKSRPKLILIEVRNIHKKKIFNLMKECNYEFLENISNYNSTDFPKWDGTHQDYIFGAK